MAKKFDGIVSSKGVQKARKAKGSGVETEADKLSSAAKAKRRKASKKS